VQAKDRRKALPALAIVIMGVSGCGKSTLGTQLAASLDCPFLEGDAYHLPESVAKMRAGRPLDDLDRWPWLDRLGTAAGAAVRAEGMSVVACSALKRIYRERLVQAAGVPMRFVLLEAERLELVRRLGQRPEHYMPASLLDSQFAILERPGCGEAALTLDSALSPERLAALVIEWAGSKAGATVHPA
jgi:gluconokinase